MTSFIQTDLQLLDASSLKLICSSPGPFITIYLPACQPGTSHHPVTPRLRRMVQSAAAELAQRRYAEPIRRLMAPLEDFVNDSPMLTGSPDSVIFRSPGYWRHLKTPGPVEERLVVATHPYITPVLPDVVPESEFYVLSVNTKSLQLGRWRAGECSEVILPRSIPRSLKEAGGFDQPDHDLEGRSAAGTSTGQMQGVHFGTASEREKFHRHLYDYFRLVDRELATHLAGATLVLVGVADEMAAYRAASEYPRLLEARHTSAAHLTWQEMAKLALEAVMSARCREAEALLHELHETSRRNRVASGVRDVLEAAHQGRVHKLLLAKGSESHGLLGPLYSIAEAQIEGEQDLVNAAAGETIRNGGEVYTLDTQHLADVEPVAALLRYSPGIA